MNWRLRAFNIPALALCLSAPALAQPVSTQAEWNTAVARQLQSKITVPREALRADTNMTLTLRIDILPNGDVETVTVNKSSGNVSVDKATIAMVQRAGRLPAFTSDMKPVKQAVSLPIRYVVADYQPNPAPPAPPAPRIKSTKKEDRS